MGQGRRPSPAAALDSAGGCAIESAPRGEDAGTASSPPPPKPASAAGLMSCPAHGSPGHPGWHVSILLSFIIANITSNQSND